VLPVEGQFDWLKVLPVDSVWLDKCGASWLSFDWLKVLPVNSVRLVESAASWLSFDWLQVLPVDYVRLVFTKGRWEPKWKMLPRFPYSNGAMNCFVYRWQLRMKVPLNPGLKSHFVGSIFRSKTFSIFLFSFQLIWFILSNCALLWCCFSLWRHGVPDLTSTVGAQINLYYTYSSPKCVMRTKNFGNEKKTFSLQQGTIVFFKKKLSSLAKRRGAYF
jgi:hypothetical protein